MNSAPPTTMLRTAAVWGTTVLAVRDLVRGECFRVGDDEGAVLPKPDASAISDLPIRAAHGGWELDATGTTGGVVYLRGRKEDPAELARSGAPIPIVPGDYGLLQYGRLSVFFQFAQAPPKLRKGRGVDWPLVLAFVFATLAVGGALALIWSITTPEHIAKPLELTTQQELAKQLNLSLTTPELGSDDPSSDTQESAPSSSPTAAKEQRRAARSEGSAATRRRPHEPRQADVPARGLGGMAEVLSGDVGEEVKKTLGTISSVAEVLGGLRSDDVVVGHGSGSGLRGGGPGGGGEAAGLPFGAGSLQTGWGGGKAGSGSAGGSGGLDRGGPGEPAGTAEHRVVGKEASRPGQGLGPGAISRVVMSRMGAFRACYESALARDPTMRGTVTVAWSIDPSGSVSAANVASSSLDNARVEGCLLRQVRRLKFPSADKPTGGVSWPFHFRPSKN